MPSDEERIRKPGWSPPEPASASPAALIMPLFGWIRYAFSVNGNTSLLSWPRLRGPLHFLERNNRAAGGSLRSTPEITAQQIKPKSVTTFCARRESHRTANARGRIAARLPDVDDSPLQTYQQRTKEMFLLALTATGYDRAESAHLTSTLVSESEASKCVK